MRWPSTLRSDVPGSDRFRFDDVGGPFDDDSSIVEKGQPPLVDHRSNRGCVTMDDCAGCEPPCECLEVRRGPRVDLNRVAAAQRDRFPLVWNEGGELEQDTGRTERIDRCSAEKMSERLRRTPGVQDEKSAIGFARNEQSHGCSDLQARHDGGKWSDDAGGVAAVERP